MTQEAISEFDMDVFAKHIGPYFSWLESKIESGWEQNDSVQKDVLKEVRSTSTTMRARFILGVSRTEFTNEVERTVELLELAKEAFPQESDELDAKIQQLTSGIAEKLGSDLLPSKYKSSEIPKTEPKIEVPKVIIEEKTEHSKTKLILEKKIKAPKLEIPKKVLASKPAPKKAEKTAKTKKVMKPKKSQTKSSLLSRIIRSMIYRGGI